MKYGIGPEQRLPWQKDIEHLAHDATAESIGQEGLTSIVHERIDHLVRIGYLAGIAGGLSLDEISAGLVEKAKAVHERRVQATT